MGLHSQWGFTLTELMITLAISSVVVTGMYGTFVQQQRVSAQQEQITEARQNARLTMDVMIEEIREAGFDPGGLAGARPNNPPIGIVPPANSQYATSLRFTRDMNCNGTLGSTQQPYEKGANDQRLGEDIAYSFDSSKKTIRRQVFENNDEAGSPESMASNIIGLNFCYILNNALNGPCTSNAPVLSANLGNIRAVQITLTATASAFDPNYTDTDPNGDSRFTHYHKATLTSLVGLRNLGINRGTDGNNNPNVLDFNAPCALP